MGDLAELLRAYNEDLVACQRCPRLIAWCKKVAAERRRAYADEEYWGRPVPHFGDPFATRLIVGLAPAAHGGNRTGRIFTGDRSGDWLFRALHRAGLASSPVSIHRADGLRLTDVLITAVAHCAPPQNRLSADEIANCSIHFERVLRLRPWKAILCLGSVAWYRTLKMTGASRATFGHGVEAIAPSGAILVGSYHPSQQNTFTGRLTEAMLDQIVGRFATIGR